MHDCLLYTSEQTENADVAIDDKSTPAPAADEELATATPRPEEEETPKKTEEKPAEKPKPVAVDPGGIEITHVVQAGETSVSYTHLDVYKRQV